MPKVQNRLRREYDILDIPINEIDPHPNQPRKDYSEKLLRELSASIVEFGVIQPLSVRVRRGRYELVSGERRLRAARLAGLEKVPCIILTVTMEESTLLALVENLERRDLNIVEEAEGLNLIMRLYGLSQEETARRLGRSQSAVANRLRLLKLSPDVLDTLRTSGLSERHGRALLRLASTEEQRNALHCMIEDNMNVALAEEYVETLLNPPPPQSTVPRVGKTLFVIKDVRMFLNSMHRWLSVMRSQGVNISCKCDESDEAVTITVRIPKGDKNDKIEGIS